MWGAVSIVKTPTGQNRGHDEARYALGGLATRSSPRRTERLFPTPWYSSPRSSGWCRKARQELRRDEPTEPDVRVGAEERDARIGGLFRQNP